jgi:hypothetical protein
MQTKVSASSALRSSEIAERVVSTLGGTSYRVAAEITGLSHETIRRMASGENVTVHALAAFCGGFQVSADWLLFGTAGRSRSRPRPS